MQLAASRAAYGGGNQVPVLIVVTAISGSSLPYVLRQGAHWDGWGVRTSTGSLAGRDWGWQQVA